jgi:hypothetical protein
MEACTINEFLYANNRKYPRIAELKDGSELYYRARFCLASSMINPKIAIVH